MPSAQITICAPHLFGCTFPYHHFAYPLSKLFPWSPVVSAAGLAMVLSCEMHLVDRTSVLAEQQMAPPGISATFPLPLAIPRYFNTEGTIAKVLVYV